MSEKIFVKPLLKQISKYYNAYDFKIKYYLRDILRFTFTHTL